MRRRERKGRSDMTAWQSYASPVGELLLAADEEGLTGLWLAGIVETNLDLVLLALQ